MAPSPKDIVDDRFELTRRLGEGAFGEVWVARDRQDGREVALKLLRPSIIKVPLLRERFEREARILRELDHPNAVRYVAAKIDTELCYLAMELVGGVTLKEEMRRRASAEERFDRDELRLFVQQCCAVLSAAHDRGVIHRDLKPANIMVGLEEGRLSRVRLLDFGIAKVPMPASDQTTVGRLLGTIAYMSPEQIRGAAVEASTDVFALGAIIFELSTLRRPFVRNDEGQPQEVHRASSGARLNSNADVVRRIAFEPRPRASIFRDDLSVRFDEVLLRALAPEAQQRLQSMAMLEEEMLVALEARPEENARRRRARLETEARPSSDPAPEAPALTAVQPQPLARQAEATDAGETATAPSPAPTTLAPPPAKKPRFPWLLLAVVSVTSALLAFWVATRTPTTERIPIAPLPEVSPDPTPRVVARTPDAGTEVRPPPPPDPAPTGPPSSPRTGPRTDAGASRADPWAFVATDPGSIRATARRLEKAAASIPDASRRASVQRCAALSGFNASAPDLRRCIALYRR